MYQLSAHAFKELFCKGEVSAQTIVESTLNRMMRHNPTLGAFLHFLPERAMQRAKELDAKRAQGKPLGRLAGVPVAIKDNIHIQGEVTTCGSRFLENYRAVFTATAVERLEAEDALLIGKTNLDEFAMGSSTENSAYHITRNPWDLECAPGGSSGGSAAAVAARLCPLALGSDTGGSIRQPAALCGVVGFKPTYGRISRYGLVAFGSSLDQIGPFAHSVADIALSMQIMGGHCPHDATSIPGPSEIGDLVTPLSLKGLKVGVPWHFLEQLTGGAKENFSQSLAVLKELGAELIDINLDSLEHSIAVYYILATAEASTNLARFDGIRYGKRSLKAATLEEVYEFSKQEGFGAEVKKRILLGTFVLSSGYKDAYYKQAQKIRTLIIEQFDNAFIQCQCIAMPTTPTTAFLLGAIQDPLQLYLQDIFTVGANLAGLPAISLPSGFDSKHRPFGLQLLGPQRQDFALLQHAYAFEMACEYSKKIPPLFDDEVIR